jgi:circadian clock protein KaiC
MFVFDEELDFLLHRARGLGFDLERMVETGAVSIEQVDAAELSPGEFAHRVRNQVALADAKLVVIDSLNGYHAAMPEENALVLHLHELLQYLNRRGATTLLTVAQHGLVGDMRSPVDLTYIADTVILLRYFEARGSVRRAVSVIKKRMGRHEDAIREFRIGDRGLVLGEPLTNMHGVFKGTPTILEPAGTAAAGTNLE